MQLQVNDYVVVDTGQGLQVGKVVTLKVPQQSGNHFVTFVRQATAEDLEKAQQDLEREALGKCKEKVAQLGLNMKPLVARCDSKNERVTVFFCAEERVDFRDLVRQLSQAMETRVELRQVGARDEAKLLGGIGRCGYPLCCQRVLTSFSSVSIKMAKEQDLALNPMKISGACGKLLCCLAYEAKEYAEVKKKMPKLKQEVLTPWGKATVIGTNVLKETVIVQLQDSEALKEVSLKDLAYPEGK